MTDEDRDEYAHLALLLERESDPEARAEIRSKMRKILDRLFHHGEADPCFLDPRLYDQWKRELAGNPEPYVASEHLTPEERLAMAKADMKLAPRDRKNPTKNPNLFPEKEIVEERF